MPRRTIAIELDLTLQAAPSCRQ